MLISLNGDWRIAVDPDNIGQTQQWWNTPVAEARQTKVPWIMQDAFPGYHGVVWYWRDFVAPNHSCAGGRYLLRFWAVDYKADVWVDGVYVGGHENAETPFTFDITKMITPGQSHRLAVRVLNPTHDRIDDIVLNETPRRCKVIPFGSGAAYNHGGIVDSVELILAPAVRVEDLFCRPDPKNGIIQIETCLHNATGMPLQGHLEFSIAPATEGETLMVQKIDHPLSPGDNRIETTLTLSSPHLWDLNDPYLYRVSVRVLTDHSSAIDERSVRVGFRDFRFENGYFRLNGRRLLIRSSHTCNHYPIGQQFPHDPDLARRDFINMKTMGFNMVRFIWGAAMRCQLDLCDEIGLLVYEESFAASPMNESPKLAERFDRAVSELIARDRNHPSVVIWGLLNETPDGPAFRHAVSMLPMIRSLDDSRMILLNSGRFDGQLSIGSLSNPGSSAWEHHLGQEAPDAQPSRFGDIAGYIAGTGDAHVYPGVPQSKENTQFLRDLGGGDKPVFLTEYGIGSGIDLWRTVRHFERLGKEYLEDAAFYRDKLDRFLADWQRWRLDECFDVPREFFTQSLKKMAGQRTLGLNAIRANPNLVGYSMTGMIDQGMTGEGLTTPFRELKPGTIDAVFDGWAPLRLCLFAEPAVLSPDQTVHLEAVLADEDILAPGNYTIRLRVAGPDHSTMMDRTVSITIPPENHPAESPFAMPIFSERISVSGPAGQYRFLADFESGAAAAGGETVFHVVREPQRSCECKSATVWGQDPEFENWCREHEVGLTSFEKTPASLREVILVPRHPASGGQAAFQNLLQRISAGATAVFLSPEVFEKIPAPAIESAVVFSPETQYHQSSYDVPNVPKEERDSFNRVLWGNFSCSISKLPEADYSLELGFCEACHFAKGRRLFDVEINGQTVLENFDVFKEAGGGWRALLRRFPVRAVDGTIQIRFLDRKEGATLNRLRLFDGDGNLLIEHGAYTWNKEKYAWFPYGRTETIPGWLYLKDEWLKKHPIFNGLPSGGLMDYTFYRDLIPDTFYAINESPEEAIAGAVKVSQNYASGLMLAIFKLGKGRIIVNSLLILKNLGIHSAAERLFNNILDYAGQEPEQPGVMEKLL
jgi:hypothetical protein